MFEENLIRSGMMKSDNGNYQKLYRFENGYGASVVIGKMSYGGDRGFFELAVIKFDDAVCGGYDLDYITPITDDVEGWLTQKDVDKLLKRIKAL